MHAENTPILYVYFTDYRIRFVLWLFSWIVCTGLFKFSSKHNSYSKQNQIDNNILSAIDG